MIFTIGFFCSFKKKCLWFAISEFVSSRFWKLIKEIDQNVRLNVSILLLGPVHTYPEIFVSANFFMRIHLASTRVRRIGSVYPEISVYALQSGNFCIRCVSGYVWTLVSVYFCIRWRQNYRRLSFLCNAHALLTNPLRCPDTNRIRVDGRIRFVYVTCGRRYFWIRIKKLRIQKSPDTCGRGLSYFLLMSFTATSSVKGGSKSARYWSDEEMPCHWHDSDRGDHEGKLIGLSISHEALF